MHALPAFQRALDLAPSNDLDKKASRRGEGEIGEAEWGNLEFGGFGDHYGSRKSLDHAQSPQSPNLSELQRLGEVIGTHAVRVVEVRDRPRDAQQAVERTRREAETFGGPS